jgi:hypothetical protein
MQASARLVIAAVIASLAQCAGTGAADPDLPMEVIWAEWGNPEELAEAALPDAPDLPEGPGKEWGEALDDVGADGDDPTDAEATAPEAGDLAEPGPEHPCPPGGPRPEECNGLDDDCDGLADEDLTRTCTTPCGEGHQLCLDGGWSACDAPTVLYCVDPLSCAMYPDCSGTCPEVFPEECNNQDDDCNGLVDDLSRECVTPCGVGHERCNAGQWTPCDAPPGVECMITGLCKLQGVCATSCPALPEETCNALDDDCDGSIDEYLSVPCEGECGPGTRVCLMGSLGPCDAPKAATCTDWSTCTTYKQCNLCPATPPEQCNGQDDDCDGATDEGDPAALCPTPGDTCINGACQPPARRRNP